MSLVVATNVSSLTAQRPLHTQTLFREKQCNVCPRVARSTACRRRSWLGHSAANDVQVNGLNMAVKNANDGISFNAINVEGGALSRQTCLRLRELAVQASNDTNTGIDRKDSRRGRPAHRRNFSCLREHTLYNNQRVLDGSFCRTNSCRSERRVANHHS